MCNFSCIYSIHAMGMLNVGLVKHTTNMNADEQAKTDAPFTSTRVFVVDEFISIFFVVAAFASVAAFLVISCPVAVAAKQL